MKTELHNALDTLQKGKLLLYPTDTVWGIGCDTTNSAAVQKVYDLKQRVESKALVCLVADENMLKDYVKRVPDKVFSILKSNRRPTTVIYNAPIHLSKNLIAQDQTVAIRICQSPFCQQLIRSFGKPIVSTSANLSGQPTPKSFSQISPEIIKGVDYVVNLQRKAKNKNPSRIIKIELNGQVKIIRE